MNINKVKYLVINKKEKRGRHTYGSEGPINKTCVFYRVFRELMMKIDMKVSCKMKLTESKTL